APCALPFCFTAPAPSAPYTLSLHDALPISTACPALPASARRPPPTSCGNTGRSKRRSRKAASVRCRRNFACTGELPRTEAAFLRSEEHTSELQSPYDLVCRLLLEKKKKKAK